MPIEVVFLDVGGPIYDDRPYYESVLRAVRELAPGLREADFWEEFESCRRDQDGSFTRRLASRFAGPDEVGRVAERARQLWSYPPSALEADAAATIPALSARYRLGVLANQEAWIRETLARDGLAGAFELWAVSAEVGIEKPDPGLFEHALRLAGAPAERCAMVGDRLDNDMIPASAAGMRAVWLLRGEAPRDPSAEQLARADAAIRSLAELPGVLDRLGG